MFNLEAVVWKTSVQIHLLQAHLKELVLGFIPEEIASGDLKTALSLT